MNDREMFEARLTEDVHGRPSQFTPAEEEASFMGLMGQAMPGMAG